jgi:hypothetical protein
VSAGYGNARFCHYDLPEFSCRRPVFDPVLAIDPDPVVLRADLRKACEARNSYYLLSDTRAPFSTPGHTPDSAMLYNVRAKRLFTGAYFYPMMLYAFCLAQTAVTMVARITYCGICHVTPDSGRALLPPRRRLGRINASTLEANGLCPRSDRVNNQIDVGTTCR